MFERPTSGYQPGEIVRIVEQRAEGLVFTRPFVVLSSDGSLVKLSPLVGALDESYGTSVEVPAYMLRRDGDLKQRKLFDDPTRNWLT